ncbi:hypothetical protein CK203_021658 [Vitis vinifera]|uniref:Uncharacterized protein n=1 Tax=Vitis vinifera TaxID=29760 RepID=A0A438J4K2_VITVI|nr:hypothetical protein CK203_021658 [Vitis vinifera]
MAGGSAMEALRERMTQLEEALGEWPRDDGTVASWAENTMGEIQLQRNMLESHDNFVEEKMAEFKTEMQSRIDEFKVTLQTYGEDIAVLKKAVLQGSPQALKPLPKLESLSPKASMATETRRNWRISCGTSSSSLRLLMFLMARRFPSPVCI